MRSVVLSETHLFPSHHESRGAKCRHWMSRRMPGLAMTDEKNDGAVEQYG
jgi:hypothetical protein